MQGGISIQKTARNPSARSYISRRDIAAFTIYDASKSMAVGYDERFLFDVFRIGLDKIALARIINGVWDVVNDSFIGVIIDRTRTRWGKFKPWMAATRLPVMLLTIFKYLIPLALPRDVDAPSKFLVHLGICLVMEGLNTFTGIAEAGLFAALTPSPNDRMAIKGFGSALSSVFDNIPKTLTGLLMDMVNHGKIKLGLTKLFAVLGSVMALFAFAFSLFYALEANERVAPSRGVPDIKKGLTAVLRNKPMRLIFLSELLNVLRIGTDKTNYFIDVLGYTSLQPLIEIPNIPHMYVSYALTGAYRRKLGMRACWILASHLEHAMYIPVFLYGIAGGTGTGRNFYDWRKMLPAFLVRDAIVKAQWGVRNVIPTEILNEALDYCEWQDGSRSEGMILASKNILIKIANNSLTWVGAAILKLIGYSVGAEIGTQSERVKYLIFLTSILLPGVTSLIGLVPKLFYNIDDRTREIMYTQLGERRRLMEDNNESRAAGGPQAAPTG